MKKIEIPIHMVDPNLYYDLQETGLAKVKYAGTDRETLVFMIFDPVNDTSKVLHKNVLENPSQTTLDDF